MGKFCFIGTGIDGLTVIEPTLFGDARGYFMETWNYRDFQEAGLDMDFVQDNQSRSQKGVLRGLHYQRTNPQGKLVRVIAGEIFDVAVDIREDSATYGKWYGAILSSENKKMIYVPEGFAHGFLVTSDIAEVIYKCTRCYDPGDEGGIIWNDPEIAIDWPDLGTPYILSEKDRIYPRLSGR